MVMVTTVTCDLIDSSKTDWADHIHQYLYHMVKVVHHHMVTTLFGIGV